MSLLNLFEKKEYVEGQFKRVPIRVIENFDELFALSYTNNSVTIEGHDIDYEDVVRVINNEEVDCDETLKKSIVNHYHTFKKVKESAQNKVDLTEELFKDFHEMLMKNIINGGLYRNVDIHIQGSKHTPTSHLRVYQKMDDLFYEIEHFKGDPIELAAYTHLRIAKVHPFLDGNGRIARMMLNYQLIRHGFLPISIPVERRKTYFQLLETYKVKHDQEPFNQFLRELVEAEYDRLVLVIRLATMN